MDSKVFILRMSSILIQYATASPVSGGSEGEGAFFIVRRSISKGGLSSAAAAASGDATLRTLKECSRCGFFEVGGESDEARRLTMVNRMKDLGTYEFHLVLVLNLACIDVMLLIHT